ncbi:hypothetical protein AU255_03110 [Methyloprofundus sedimenti]|uniref:DUF4912 domain-containing protein n=2 Tax=Methyloprofundus sedimenti TaxID=1420851 RepID=A0A1V8M5S9_9GAMM|nr:hypothetical protein AU255_03110 [Methyloprofundus sedimenti]
MPVDPVNLYAYWNLKQSETENIIEHLDKQLALRIYTLPELSADPSNVKLSFDIKVQGFQNRQKVHLPVAASAYSAVIGEINADDSFSALATAETIHVPRQSPVSEINIDNTVNALQFSQTQEDKLIRNHQPQKNQVTEDHVIESKNIPQTEQPSEDNYVTETNAEVPWSEALILKNFQGYGYDLKVFEKESDAESITTSSHSTLAKQIAKTHTSSKTTKTKINNTSGPGRLF